jgi:hypothetical protein
VVNKWLKKRYSASENKKLATNKRSDPDGTTSLSELFSDHIAYLQEYQAISAIIVAKAVK